MSRGLRLERIRSFLRANLTNATNPTDPYGNVPFMEWPRGKRKRRLDTTPEQQKLKAKARIARESGACDVADTYQAAIGTGNNDDFNNTTSATLQSMLRSEVGRKQRKLNTYRINGQAPSRQKKALPIHHLTDRSNNASDAPIHLNPYSAANIRRQEYKMLHCHADICPPSILRDSLQQAANGTIPTISLSEMPKMK